MQYRTIKNEDADEVLFILRECLEVLCKAEKEFTSSMEKNKEKLGVMYELAKHIQMANDIKIRKIQKAIDIMTFGSETNEGN